MFTTAYILYGLTLAYIDSLLSCLVHLTATLGWSGSKTGTYPMKLLANLVIMLCNMINVFHRGKSLYPTSSMMGLSVTRHSVLTLNHLLMEMKSSSVKVNLQILY